MIVLIIIRASIKWSSYLRHAVTDTLLSYLLFSHLILRWYRFNLLFLGIIVIEMRCSIALKINQGVFLWGYKISKRMEYKRHKKDTKNEQIKLKPAL